MEGELRLSRGPHRPHQYFGIVTEGGTVICMIHQKYRGESWPWDQRGFWLNPGSSPKQPCDLS